MSIKSMYGFGGKPRRTGASTKSNPMPGRQSGRPSPDRASSHGVDHGEDITRMDQPRTGNEQMQSSGRPKPEHMQMRAEAKRGRNRQYKNI